MIKSDVQKSSDLLEFLRLFIRRLFTITRNEIVFSIGRIITCVISIYVLYLYLHD